MTRAPCRHVITVEVDLAASELTERMPPNSGDITPVDAGGSRLVTGHDSVDAVLADLLMLDVPLRVIDPPPARERAALLARRLSPES